MKFRPLATSLVLIASAAVAHAAGQASTMRLGEIWNAVDDRVSRQIDVWFDGGDFPKSIHLLLFEATYWPHNYDVATNLGWMLENVEEWDSALEVYKQYYKNNPQDKDRALAEADYFFRRKQYAKVPDLLEPVLKLNPHANNFRILAHAYERLNRFDDAKRVWQEYLDFVPDDASAKVNLARVVRKLKAAPAKS